METKRYAGSFTVFFSLLCLPMILLWTSLFGLARRMVERNDALRMTREAGESVLSCYCEKLTRRYGMYATEGSVLEARWDRFLKMNQASSQEEIRMRPSFWLNPQELWTGFFTYQIEEVKLSGLKTLQDPDVFREQIHRFMEYRVIKEGVQQLLEYMGILEDTTSGKGIQGQYGQIQRILTEYNEQYGQLVKTLYSIDSRQVYVTMTRESPYRPTDFQEEARRLEAGGTWSEEEISTWLERGNQLRECNRKAEEITGDLEQIIQDLQETLRKWDEDIAALDEEQRQQSYIQDLSREVDGIKESLWGLRGEAEELKKILADNQDCLRKWETQVEEVQEGKHDGEIVGEEQCLTLALAAERLFGYQDQISLEYEIQEGGREWDLGAIWEWILGWKADLREYGEDVDLAEETAFMVSEEEALQQALKRLEEESEAAGEGIEEKIYWVEYLIGMFRNVSDQLAGSGQNLRGEAFGESVFRNECEFVIEGKYNEYENLKGIEYRILGIRLAMNMAHLMTDSEKQATIRRIAGAAGGIIAPGIGNAVVYGAILFLWSTAESYVDFGMLIQGKEVPLLKNSESWQTDLQKIMEMEPEGRTEKETKGLDYEMYLRLLALLSDTETSIERIQTLIHLNMQQSGISGFQLSDMVSGFHAETIIRGGMESYGTQGDFRYE